MAAAMNGRMFRRLVLDHLRTLDTDRAIEELVLQAPIRRLVRPLMSLIRSDDERIKHRAITALGIVTVKLGEADLEAARDVLRRLFLSLTEESGGIGWGSPEAIGEILARHEGLSEEYTDIFLSYARVEEDNYLDHEPLLRGVLWGLARLAHVRRDLLIQKGAMGCLRPHLRSHDATVRALAARTIVLLGMADESSPEWKTILEDSHEICVYIDDHLMNCHVNDLVRGTFRTE